MWQGLEEAHFWSLSHQERYMTCFFNKFRWWSSRRKRKDADSDDEVLLARLGSYTGFKELKRDEKARVMQLFMEESNGPPWLRTWVENVWSESKQMGGRSLDSKSVLFTWQGEWGLLTEWSPSPTMPLEDLVRRLRLEEQMQALWEEFQKYVIALSARLPADVWAASLELCTETWAEQRVVRVHAHAYFKSFGGKIKLHSLRSVSFRASAPHKGSCSMGSHRNTGSFAGAYYLLCPKTGVLWSDSNRKPFVDFPVQARWVLQMTVAGKMPQAAARAEVVRTGDCLTRRLPDFDRYFDEVRAAELQAHVAQRVGELESSLSPSRRLPEVEAWQAMYGEGAWHRKKFLVLDGPSGMGKTEFAKGLFGAGNTLELNCAATQHLVLREFNARQHRCIFLDEAPPEYVLKERKIFQCPSGWVELGASPTGNMTYKVWLNDACIVIASNTWTERVAQLGLADQAWIKANSVCVRVEAPLWLPRP